MGDELSKESVERQLEDGYVIHFQNRLYRVVTMSRTITKKVKLAPVARSADTLKLSPDGEPEWHDLEGVERHARIVDTGVGPEQP